jgi:hypothetical protein
MTSVEQSMSIGAARAASASTATELARCRPDAAVTRRAVRRLRAKTAVIGMMVFGCSGVV